MSTPNFCTMDRFPLFVLDTEPEDDEGEPMWMDAWEIRSIMERLTHELEGLNDTLLFHYVSVRSGYYTGLQFYVSEDRDPSGEDNDYCRMSYDLCRSKAIRRYNGEQTRITRALRKLAKEYGFEEYYCAGVFGNGSAIYNKVRNDKGSQLRRAATELPAFAANNPLIGMSYVVA